MTEDKKDKEIVAFVDFFPNIIRAGNVQIAEDYLRKNFESTLPGKIARYGKLPYLITQVGIFSSLLRETRLLYVDEHYRAAVALCGMTVEALVIEIARERVTDNELLKGRLTDTNRNCRSKIKPLGKYLRIPKSAKFLHKVLDIRREYLHLHKMEVLHEEVLACINSLHLFVIAEYGFIPAKGGKVQPPTEEYLDELATRMGVQF